MSASRAQLRLESLRRALTRLGEALEEPEDSPLNPDGTIQRFDGVPRIVGRRCKSRSEAGLQFGLLARRGNSQQR